MQTARQEVQTVTLEDTKPAMGEGFFGKFPREFHDDKLPGEVYRDLTSSEKNNWGINGNYRIK